MHNQLTVRAMTMVRSAFLVSLFILYWVSRDAGVGAFAPYQVSSSHRFRIRSQSPFSPLSKAPSKAPSIARLESSLSYNGQQEEPKHEKEPGPVSSILASIVLTLWKGLTIPFPSLRRALGHSSKKRSQSIGLTNREGVVAFLTYLLFGVTMFHQLEADWSIIDALYFSATCFTTIGYGDLTPSTQVSKIFTMFFGVGGVAFLGSSIATVTHSVLEKERHAIDKAKSISRRGVLTLFHDMNEKLSHFRHHLSEEEQQSKLQQAREKHERRQKKRSRGNKEFSSMSQSGDSSFQWLAISCRIFWQSIPSLSMILAGGFVMRYLNGDAASWSPLECVYFSFITASSIGFGDFSPQTQIARAFGIFFLPLAVACAGEIFSAIALASSDQRQQKVFEQEFERGFSMKHLQDMDADQSGQVSREEYVTFMLLEMGRVDPGELRQLHNQFERLDVNNTGYLNEEDLKLMAQLRGKEVHS